MCGRACRQASIVIDRAVGLKLASGLVPMLIRHRTTGDSPFALHPALHSDDPRLRVNPTGLKQAKPSSGQVCFQQCSEHESSTESSMVCIRIPFAKPIRAMLIGRRSHLRPHTSELHLSFGDAGLAKGDQRHAEAPARSRNWCFRACSRRRQRYTLGSTSVPGNRRSHSTFGASLVSYVAKGLEMHSGLAYREALRYSMTTTQDHKVGPTTAS